MSLSDGNTKPEELVPTPLKPIRKAPERKRPAGRLDFLLTDLLKLPKGMWLPIECHTDKEVTCVRGFISMKTSNYSMKSKSPLAGWTAETRKFGTILYVKLTEPKVAPRIPGD